LQNLRELQLLMFAMYDSSLEDIYVFLVACCPSLLERLFVEVKILQCKMILID
jgi:hypothetical protein